MLDRQTGSWAKFAQSHIILNLSSLSGRRLRFGFTLAEVLIVLGIIGIVAEMTIPTLVQNTQETVTVTSVKKAYSVLSQAYTMAVQDNGTPENWNLGAGNGDWVGSINVLNALAPYLKISKNCGNGQGCMPNETVKWLQGTPFINFDTATAEGKAILSDGTTLYTYTYGACSPTTGIPNACASMGVDINGFKKPNQIGVDIFEFYITTTGIVPVGAPADTGANSTFSGNCAVKASASGEGCAGWVIYSGNMDYLRCSDLAWNGKRKCG